MDVNHIIQQHGFWLDGSGGTRANLSWANLSEANLSEANLSWANLSRANLSRANLSRADLSRANLSRANLSEANLSEADLIGTCLDPSAFVPDPGDAAIIAAGFEIKDGWVYGWRTTRSQYVGRQTYTPGIYTAPVFSVADTECHPGIYLASRAWLDKRYPGVPVVRCRTRRELIHHAGDKWRTKELEVLPNE